MTTATHTVKHPVQPAAPDAREMRLLPLVGGERLAREEFHRRYEAMPEAFRAELIEGVVHVTSPVRIRHGQPHADIVGWLFTYRSMTQGVSLLDNTTDFLDDANEYQPDSVLRIEPEVGGKSHITPDDYVEGAPELAVEVAVSSIKVDTKDKAPRHNKLTMFRG